MLYIYKTRKKNLRQKFKEKTKTIFNENISATAFINSLLYISKSFFKTFDGSLSIYSQIFRFFQELYQ